MLKGVNYGNYTSCKRAKRKDADAFTELMESQMQNMYKVARSILSRDEDVADAISDTILVCWEKIDTLKKNRFFGHG